MKRDRNILIIMLFISAILMAAVLRPDSDDTLSIPANLPMPIERVL